MTNLANLTVSQNQSIQWPKWTDAFNEEIDYVGLTAKILCGLYDGSCDDCQCSDPEKSQYGAAVRAALPHVWPRGPLEMVMQFNRFADMQGMPDRDRVRNPVESAFAKLTEHAAFWVYVKSVMRARGIGQPSDPRRKPGPERRAQIGDRVGNLIVNDVAPSGMPGYKCGSCETTAGAVSGPAPIKQETVMPSDTVNPFEDNNPFSKSPNLGMEDQPPNQMSNTGLYVAAGLGLLLIGGIIAADMYRTSKGIRPVYVAPPMVPMGAYY